MKMEMQELIIKFEKELYSRERRSRHNVALNNLYSELKEGWIAQNRPLHYCFVDLDSLEESIIRNGKN